MKSFLKILFFFFLITQICLGQWYQQNSGTTESLHSIKFINDTVGWAAGGDGAFGSGGIILKTSNGGITWDQQSTGLLYELFDLYMINENKGWAVGEAGAIITTTDGGANWTQQQQPFGTNCTLLSVYFINENLGWTVGSGSSEVILKTTDGGVNWIPQTADTNLSWFPLTDIFIINENIGWVSGHIYYTSDTQGVLLRTTDGGANWTNIDYGGEGAISSIQFLNENIGWFYITTGPRPFLNWDGIYKTTDGGNNWECYNLLPLGCVFGSIYFINEDIGWVIGNDNIKKTEDGGSNWTLQYNIPNTYLPSIYFVDSTCGWAVGGMGTILHTTNGGVTFVEEEQIDELPTDFLLSQNYPNPFNNSCAIKYSIPKSSPVSLKIFNVLGSEIETLINEEKTSGTYELKWNAANLPSGVYFYKLQAGDFIQTRKMILLK